MNKINTIYTTISNGKTHIAADDKYIGSVDSYNNCLTQLFAWIFNRSIKVNFDGRTRTLNKESYQNLLLSLSKKNEIVKQVSEATFFRGVAENAELPQSNLRMRDVISDKHRVNLFYKLAKAIAKNNTDKALLMIGKGAALDIEYYDRAGLGLSFRDDDSYLISEKRYKFKVFKGTPILQAAMKANNVIVNRLREAGANINLTGQQYIFERAIVDVQHHVDFDVQPVMHISHRPHRRYPRMHTSYQPRFHERTSIITEDTRTSPVIYRLTELSVLRP